MKWDHRECCQLTHQKVNSHPGQSSYSPIAMVVSIKDIESRPCHTKILNYTSEDHSSPELIWNTFSKNITWKLPNKWLLPVFQQEPWLLICGPIIFKDWWTTQMLYRRLLTLVFSSMIQQSPLDLTNQHWCSIICSNWRTQMKRLPSMNATTQLKEENNGTVSFFLTLILLLKGEYSISYHFMTPMI